MRETFVIRLKEACGVSPGQHVLVAVSGGADSTALLCLFDEIREAFPLQISCAHVEHGIRGAASVEDMRFVEALCAQKNIPFYGSQVDATAYARAHKCGLEDAARTLRYNSLMETAKAVGADAIALAHHQGIRRKPCCCTRRGEATSAGFAPCGRGGGTLSVRC